MIDGPPGSFPQSVPIPRNDCCPNQFHTIQLQVPFPHKEKSMALNKRGSLNISQHSFLTPFSTSSYPIWNSKATPIQYKSITCILDMHVDGAYQWEGTGVANPAFIPECSDLLLGSPSRISF